MLKYFFLFLFLALPISYASSLDNLKKQTQEPLYFSVPIQSFEISKKDKITLKVRLAKDTITVMTDRPYRKVKSVKPQTFIKYIMEKSERKLIFTLSLQKDNQPILINFKKQKASFSEESHEITFNNIQLPQSISDQLKVEKAIKGENATLIVEG